MHFSRILFRSIAAGLVLSLLVAVPAEAQSPGSGYQTVPRSGGGKAARFGGMSSGGKRSSSFGANGAAPPPAGTMLQAPQRGASRPSVGSMAPSAPIKGGLAGAGGDSANRRASGGNAVGGTQVYTTEQFKSGSVNNNGMIFGPRRGR